MRSSDPRQGSGPQPTVAAAAISARLQQLADPERARLLQRYFKTGPGEYAEGDVFVGLKVPEVRSVLKEFRQLTPAEVLPLLASGIHEERLFALLALVRCFDKGDSATREQIYSLYLAHTCSINNWDLVDCSAPAIVGGYLLERSREPLYNLARSEYLWERRTAILATFAFIRYNQFDDSLAIGKMMLTDREDLIHKAAGWMLREIGKRDQAALEEFLRCHCRVMPRTMLRYAIERFPAEKRQMYLKGSEVGVGDIMTSSKGPIGFTLDKVVPWGRSYDEYVSMFGLSEADLGLRILGCGDGPAAFNAGLTGRGGRIVSIDPVYAFDAGQIRGRIAETYETVMTQLRRNRDDFVWSVIPSVEELGKLRMAAMETFLADLDAGKQAGRYLPGELPELPFADGEFDLALSSHFLFLYSDHLSAQFHLEALREMLRVANEVRVFPLVTLANALSPHLQLVTEQLENLGFSVEAKRVPYEFQRGGNEMLVIRHP